MSDLPHRLLGVDFSSRPSRRKPIVVASGQRRADEVRLDRLQGFESLEEFGQWLADPSNGPWTGGFDLPFGLPRELVEALDWPRQWLPLMRHYGTLPRSEIRATFARFCNHRPVGGKFAHRACDRPAGSSPSMKWVNPPVAYMMHAGVPLQIDAEVHLPCLHDGDRLRVALEAYPGLLARELIGRRSYKSDELARQTAARQLARDELLAALEQGRGRLHLSLLPPDGLRETLRADASGDSIDAVLCLMQTAWAVAQPHYGLPTTVDPLEGWIISA